MRLQSCMIAILVCSLLSAALSGYAVYRYLTRGGNPENVVTGPVNSPAVKYDYAAADRNELQKRLFCYDNEIPVLNYTVLRQSSVTTDIEVKGALCERGFSQNISVPVAQQGNFKFYVGLGLGVVVASGAVYGAYKLIQAVR